MVRNKNVIHLSEIPLEQMKAPEGSSFGGQRRRVGVAIGAKKLGCSFFIVTPGNAAFPFHLHHTNEELIYILEGDAILRLGQEEIPVSSGTFVSCPPGAEHPHQLINASKNNLRYIVVSTMEYPDISEYPDSNKIGAYVTSAAEDGFRALYRKDTNVSYFEGEDGSALAQAKRSTGRS